MESKQNPSSGGRRLTVTLAGIFIVAGFALAGFRWNQRDKGKNGEMPVGASPVVSETAPVHRPPSRLDFDASDLDSLEPLEDGEPVTLRRFLVVTEDPRSTEAEQQTFREQAHGRPASWHLVFQTSGEVNGTPMADFLVRYAFLIEGGMSGSAMVVRAEFDESQGDALRRLGKDDGVVVSGTLDLSGDQVRITGARLAPPESPDP